jgi:hypothetical protein
MENIRSPFSIYEEKFCDICSEYNSCIGFISSASTSMGIEEHINTKNMLSGDKMFLDMVKGIGASLYTHKFKMILDCMEARKLMNDIQTLGADRHSINIQKTDDKLVDELDENKIVEWKCLTCKERFITRRPNYCPFCGIDYNKIVMGLFPEKNVQSVIYKEE